MQKEAIYHRSLKPFSCNLGRGNVEIMIKTKRGDILEINCIYGDPNQFSDSCRQFMKKTGTTKLFDFWKITIHSSSKRLRYLFYLKDQVGHTQYYTERGFSNDFPKDINACFAFPYVHDIDIYQSPEWVKTTVWYQIFPDRFANGNPILNPPNTLKWGETAPTYTNVFGGDFNGMINKLDYLESLGITGIYLCPIFASSSNHKYDTTDYFEIDPQFGDKETFRKLIQACHERRIKVMLDAVFNHSGFYFPAFQDVLAKDEASSYKNWFHIRDFPIVNDPVPNYETFGYEAHMPKLNTANEDVKRYLLNVARYWIEEFDIDGWRLDVANEIDHSFWRDFRKEIKAIKPDVFILGEIWHDSMAWLQGDQFDATMNYPFYYAITEFFAKQAINTSDFSDLITNLLHSYPSPNNYLAFNIVGSHDTERILTLSNHIRERVKLIYLFQMSFLGTPCIYYGDEIGMLGGPDPDCRACMEWDDTKQDKELYGFIRKLINLREKVAAFGNEASFKFIEVEDSKRVIAYEKRNKTDQLIFILNISEQPISVNIPLLKNRNAREIFHDQFYDFSNNTLIKLAAYD